MAGAGAGEPGGCPTSVAIPIEDTLIHPAREQVAVGEYVGQAVTCTPQRNTDGTMGEPFRNVL